MRSKLKLNTAHIATRADAEAAITAYAQLAINLKQTTAAMDAEVARIRDQYQARLDTLNRDLKDHTEALCEWAQTNPGEFAKGRKSIEFANGTLGFRTGTPKLALASRAWNWEKVLSAVQSILPSFVRGKLEVDKEAILGQRDGLAEILPRVGLKITQDETFFVDPKLTDPETRQTQPA